jgi:hypothetical protein
MSIGSKFQKCHTAPWSQELNFFPSKEGKYLAKCGILETAVLFPPSASIPVFVYYWLHLLGNLTPVPASESFQLIFGICAYSLNQ